MCSSPSCGILRHTLEHTRSPFFPRSLPRTNHHCVKQSSQSWPGHCPTHTRTLTPSPWCGTAQPAPKSQLPEGQGQDKGEHRDPTSWPALTGTCWGTQPFVRVHSPSPRNSHLPFPQKPILSTRQEGTFLGFCTPRALGANCAGHPALIPWVTPHWQLLVVGPDTKVQGERSLKITLGTPDRWFR